MYAIVRVKPALAKHDLPTGVFLLTAEGTDRTKYTWRFEETRSSPSGEGKGKADG
jgi:hypothetical protein